VSMDQGRSLGSMAGVSLLVSIVTGVEGARHADEATSLGAIMLLNASSVTRGDMSRKHSSFPPSPAAGSQRRRFRPSLLTVLLFAGFATMVVGHAGRPTWYWMLLPAAAFASSLYVDVLLFRRRQR
jgi:hypothetical protein